jgi:hypothetical protein
MIAANSDSNAAQERMLGSVPGVPAAGRGPAQDGDFSRHEYQLPRGCAAGYMPELNVLCGIADYSAASGQPITKHLETEVTPSPLAGAGR